MTEPVLPPLPLPDLPSDGEDDTVAEFLMQLNQQFPSPPLLPESDADAHFIHLTKMVEDGHRAKAINRQMDAWKLSDARKAELRQKLKVPRTKLKNRKSSKNSRKKYKGLLTAYEALQREFSGLENKYKELQIKYEELKQKRTNTQ